MHSSIRLPRAPKNLTDDDLAWFQAHNEIEERLDAIWCACYMNLLGKTVPQQKNMLKGEYHWCFKDIQRYVARWDQEIEKRVQKVDPDMDIHSIEDYCAVASFLNNKTVRPMKHRRRHAEPTMRDVYKGKQWEMEYHRLAILFHLLIMRIKKSRLKLPNGIEEDILAFFYRVFHLSAQQKRIVTLQENKKAEKAKPRQQILGMAIDELLRTKGEHIKSAKQYAIEKFTGLRKKKGASEEYKKKRRSIIQNVRRRYLPEGFESDPVFKFSLEKIKGDSGEELNKLKSDLGGKDWSNSPPSGSQDQHYVHLSKAQAGAWFEKIAQLAAEEFADS